MPQPPLSDEKCQEVINALAEHGSILAAARATGINRSTFEGRLREARRRGFKANVAPAAEPVPAPPPAPSGDVVDITDRLLATLRKAPGTLDD